MPAPLVIAHRGASADAPEHTAVAYLTAAEQGADFIELDLRLTADGVVVCLHDPTLERIAARPHAVADLTLAELRSLDIGSWFDRRFADERVLTLDDALDVIPDHVGLYLELKDPADRGGQLEAAVVRVLEDRERLDPDRTILESFDVTALRTVRGLAPGIPTSLAWFQREEGLVAGRLPAWVDISAPNAFTLFLAPGHVAAVHATAREVHTWTVDEADEIAAVLELAVDGIFTNRPAVAREVIERRRLDDPAPGQLG